MKALIAISLGLAALALTPPRAGAAITLLPGEQGFDVTATAEGGVEPELRAGAHPYSIVTEVAVDRTGPGPAEDIRGIELELPPGLIENPEAVERCERGRFTTPRSSPFEASLSGESCPDRSQVGIVTVRSAFGGGEARSFGLFNLVPPPGAPAQLGFSPYGVPVTLTPRIREAGGEFGLTLAVRNLSQQVRIDGLRFEVWGTPWSVVHNEQRGDCLKALEPDFGWAKCSTGPASTFPRLAYLTLSAHCEAPVVTRVRVDSWQDPGAFAQASAASEDAGGEPTALEDCDGVPFAPSVLARLAGNRASSSSGYDFNLDGEGGSLVDPARRVGSQVRRAVLTLPEGATINASLGVGLGVCEPGQFAAETVDSAPGAGCPNASKIGVLSLVSPLFGEPVEGSMFLARPDDPATAAPGSENPFDSMLALYLVAKAPERGVMVKVAGELRADPASGRLTATFDRLPQVPYTHFNVHFRNTQRAPLAAPATCGSYPSVADLSPWRDPGQVVRRTSMSAVIAGVGGGPCPTGTPGFAPGGAGGMLVREAGSYSSFILHLTRRDTEQEITSYSAELPPGLSARLAGVPYCPEEAIAAARGRSGVAELARPSCPEASRIGHTYSGYGLGPTLAYAPGGLYLAGPYGGAPLSIVAIDSATVGPFDLGVIVVRSAIRVDPRSTRVSIDSAGSDPIPHILSGIPLHLRDVRVFIDRGEFTRNPTSCAQMEMTSVLGGSGPVFGDPSDDVVAEAPAPFQVSGCGQLGFRPRLRLALRGGAERGDNPALRAEVRARPGDAGLASTAVTLPPSIFLAQDHIDGLCTGRQWAEGRCPADSVYGHARVFTPLLDRPLEGPVHLRSSPGATLPEVAIRLGGQVAIEVFGRIDAIDGGLRGRFEGLPDAPFSRFVMNLRGGRRGVLENGEDLCRRRQQARVKMIGHNNRGVRGGVGIALRCGGKHRGEGKGRGGRR